MNLSHTFGQIRQSLRDLGGQPSGGDFDKMADRAINQYYRMILAFVDQDEQTREFTLTTVADQKDYGCPTYVKRIINIEDADNRRNLDEISPLKYNTYYPGTTASGDPRKYSVLGNFGVQAQPSAATTVQVVSSEASDATARYLRVQGFDASDRLIDESLTLNGTTAVTSTASFEKIETAVKSSDTGTVITGYLTLSDGTTTFAVIPYWDEMSSHLWIRIYPIPDAVVSLTVQAVMRKPDLVRDDDWPQFDPDYHHLLISGPASDLLPKVGLTTLGVKLLSDYKDNLKTFKGTQSRRPNFVHHWADVSSGQTLPDRPLIEGVDYI